ncbi:MAG: hypothetical protein ACOX41_01850 [Anaerovoracaceae bacterium]|jgi:hypothetical protein
MLKYWYQFIPEAASTIEMGRGDLYYEKIVKPGLHGYTGSVFKDMCRYYTFEKGLSWTICTSPESVFRDGSVLMKKCRILQTLITKAETKTALPTSALVFTEND